MNNKEENFAHAVISWHSTSNDKPLSNPLFIRDFFDKRFTF